MNQISVDVNDMLNALKAQRNQAQDDNALHLARIADLERQVKKLEEQHAPSDPPKP